MPSTTGWVMTAGYMQLWGKTAEGAPLWHPACCHMLDVAACAERLFEVRPISTGRLAATLGVGATDLRRWLVAAIAVHDLGKLTRAFQAKVPELWREDLIGPLAPLPPTSTRHDRLLAGWISARAAVPSSAMDPKTWPIFSGVGTTTRKGFASKAGPIASALCGHHGRPVEGEALDDLALEQDVGEACERLAASFLDDWFRLVDPPTMMFTAKQALAASWLINGLTTTADWLGSWQSGDGFRPTTRFGEAFEGDLAGYWHDVARPTAAKVVIEAGLVPARPSRGSSAKALFGIDAPRPMQALAETVHLPEGPVIVVVEDLTGGGKTEGATIIAHRLMARGDAGGVYMALPTMATAGAMFDRLAGTMSAMFEPGGRRPSLSLAHGRAHLDDRFSSIPSEAIAGAGDDAGTWCSEWLRDDRRKSFLSDVGAGTVDQALLGVLPARFGCLRSSGLADRVLVVDEAHAYDGYTGGLLRKLIAFHWSLGGSTVVLSATLPSSQREEIEACAGSPRDTGAAEEPDQAPYPLVTVVGRGGVARHPVGHHVGLERVVEVTREAEPASAIAWLEARHGAGDAVAYVRNSVGDAIEAATELRSRGVPCTLFHARMAMVDRARVERSVLDAYGRGATPTSRRASVLVATQVVEQSLDLDLDGMATDLAPVDLLLQRMGRVWRHMDLRPASARPTAHPEMHLVTNEPGADAARDWVAGLLRATGFVYDDHGLLWRTARALASQGWRYRLPEDVRSMVEEVYASENVPEALRKSSEDAQAYEMAARSQAGAAALVPGNGYGQAVEWEVDSRILTRIGPPRTTVRLAVEDGGRVRPWATDAHAGRAWAMSEVDVPRHALADVVVAGRHAAMVARAREGMSRFDRDVPVAVLERRADDLWQARGVDARGRPVEVSYGREVGLATKRLDAGA